MEPKDPNDVCSNSDDLDPLERNGDLDSNTQHELINGNSLDLNTDSNMAFISTNDTTSLEILNKCHLVLFPKKTAVCDDDSCMKKVLDTVPILSGEYICFIGPSGKSNEDILVVTDYRLFALIGDGSNGSKSFINVPLMLIEAIELRENVFVYVFLKNGKTIRLTFSTSEKTAVWAQRLNSFINRMYKLEDLFSFRFYSWLTNESKQDDMNDASMSKCLFSKNEQTSNLMNKEFKRMKFDAKLWRLSDVNRNFQLCPTYPESLIVPKSITDEQLKKDTTFRSSQRIPVVVWRSKKNGAVLARSSQPNVGLLAWRLNEDELLLKAIADSCSNTKKADKQSPDTTCPNSLLLIIDARFRSVALANRVKGGGYEYSEYYTNSEIKFMNLENIHVIRSSFQSLRLLCQTVNDNRLFLSQLENTKWLHHLSGIIKAANTVTSSIDQGAKPVLIHCSDGWDRTPQILGLAKLLLDPYYRTISGFRILIEIDWLQFGHKFAQRNGHCSTNSDVNERCPVFLQWLDCVYQISRQYPSAFQFNEIFLLKLCYHSYSCLFGTFLCDSNIERSNEHTDERTFSIWSYLNDKNVEIVNHLYDDTLDEVLYPMSEIANMQLWHRLFCEPEMAYLVKVDRQETQCFNDSLDYGTSSGTITAGSNCVLYGSSPLSDLVKLTPESSVSSSSNYDNFKINNLLLKNAIIDHTQTTPNSTQSNNANTPNTTVSSLISNVSLMSKKTRSCDDLCKLSSSVKQEDDQCHGCAQVQVQGSKTRKRRVSSEPNLFVLEEAMASSFINSSNQNNSCINTKLLDNRIVLKDDLKEMKVLNEIETENKDTQVAESSSACSLLDTLLMQNSTDTLVDETQLLLKRLSLSNELSIRIECKASSSSSTTSEQEECSSTTSTASSTIPSPSSVKNGLSLLNSVSTSTTGLSDHATEPSSHKSLIHLHQNLQYHQRFNLLNDTIKSYFNSNYDFIFNQNQQSLCEQDGDGDGDVDSGFRKRLFDVHSQNGSLTNTNLSNANSRKSSNSIPIVNNQNKNIENLMKKRSNNKNKKAIKDLIDVDGLTKIEDPSYRKIIERDELNREHSQSDENQNTNCYSYGNESVCSSWDEIEESDYKLATWVPDFYVTHCQSCSQKFSYRLRKHHCRNCGQVFCYKCADYFSPIPSYNLHAPVRVCYSCKLVVEKQLQKQQSQQMFSSTPPALHNSNSTKLNSLFNSSRCNHALDSNKFKKSDSNKSQKVSV